MKKLLILLAIITMGFGKKDTDYSRYFSIVEKRWGSKCASSDSYEVTLKNDNSENMDVQIAIKKIGGKWDVGIKTNISPNGKTDWWTCHSNGQIKYWARPSNMANDIKFLSTEEINDTYP